MYLHNCRCFQQHLKMLLQSLSAHCKAPGEPGSIWKYLEVLVRATGVSVKFAWGIWTDLHFADGLIPSAISLAVIPWLFFYYLTDYFPSSLNVSCSFPFYAPSTISASTLFSSADFVPFPFLLFHPISFRNLQLENRNFLFCSVQPCPCKSPLLGLDI